MYWPVEDVLPEAELYSSLGILGTVKECPSGIVIENGTEGWGVSPIHGGSIAEDLVTGHEERSCFAEGILLLNENISLLDIMMSDSSDFSGFFNSISFEWDDPQVDLTLAEAQLEELSLSHHLVRMDSSACAVRGRLVVAADRLSSLRSTIEKRRRSSRSDKRLQVRGLNVDHGFTPVSTRSRGPVEELPHVMPKILEYGIPRKKDDLKSDSGDCK